MSNIIRIKFTRGEEVKYISHLDLMKSFERSLRRSGIPIAYSQGFNPHPQMVFGLPLSVGVTSESEYADFELSQDLKPGEFIERLNNELPEGLEVIQAVVKESKSNIMATITQASYEVLVCPVEKMGINNMQKILTGIMQRRELITKKEGKNGLKEIDIKPMILDIELRTAVTEAEIGDEQETACRCTNEWLLSYIGKLSSKGMLGPVVPVENLFCLYLMLSAGSKANLKPELLIAALNEVTDLKLKLVKIHRTGLFVSKGGEVLDPLSGEALSTV